MLAPCRTMMAVSAMLCFTGSLADEASAATSTANTVMRREDGWPLADMHPTSVHKEKKARIEVHSTGSVMQRADEEEMYTEDGEKHVKPHSLLAKEGESDEGHEVSDEHARRHVSIAEMAELLEASKFMPEAARELSESMVEVDYHAAGKHSHTRAPKDIQFGIYARRVITVDVLKKTWTGDLVITTSWNDPKVAQTLPQGKNESRFATEDARKIMWLPDVGITNREFKSVEIMSSSVKVWSSGWATKVERVLATMENDFDTSAYPWDKQTLQVVIASEKLMSDELVMKPHTDSSLIGVNDNVLSGTGFIGAGGTPIPDYSADAFEEADAMLIKSRGVFRINVIRNPGATMRTLFGPTIILLSVSYINFWFPLLPPFSMPRFAASVIPLLIMVTFTTKSKIPDSWTDVYNETICLIIACVSVLSLTVEITLHTCKNEAFANELNFQYRVGYPIGCLSFILLTMCFMSGQYNDACTALVRSLVIVLLAVNIGRVYRRNKQDAEGGAPKAPEPSAAPPAAAPKAQPKAAAAPGGGADPDDEF